MVAQIPNERRCIATNNPGRWPYVARCIKHRKHKGLHENQFRQTWTQDVRVEQIEEVPVTTPDDGSTTHYVAHIKVERVVKQRAVPDVPEQHPAFQAGLLSTLTIRDLLTEIRRRCDMADDTNPEARRLFHATHAWLNSDSERVARLLAVDGA